MVSPGTLGALAGFLGAMVTIGVPLAGFLYKMATTQKELVKLLKGHEEIEGDGVIPRLRNVEEDVERHRTALESEGIVDPEKAEATARGD